MAHSTILTVSGREAFRQTSGTLVRYTEVTTTYCPRSDADMVLLGSRQTAEHVQAGSGVAQVEWSSGAPLGVARPRADAFISRPKAYAFLCHDGAALVTHFVDKWREVDILRESAMTGAVIGLTLAITSTVAITTVEALAGLVTGTVTGGVAASAGLSGLTAIRAVTVGAIAGGVKGGLKGALCAGNVIPGCVAGAVIGIIVGAGQYVSLRRARHLDQCVSDTIITVVRVGRGESSFQQGLSRLDQIQCAAESLRRPHEDRQRMPAFRALQEAQHALTDRAAPQALLARQALPPRDGL